MQQSPREFIKTIYKKIESRGEIDRCEYLCKNRTELEKPIFDYLRAQYLPFLQEWWKTYTLPTATAATNSILMYETRQHENLEFLIYNSTYYCPNWTLTIYCTHQNYAYICDILAHNKDRATIHILTPKAGKYTEDRNAYNIFMKSAQLWASLPFEYVIIIEMDTYLLRHIPMPLTADYYCAAWPWLSDVPGGSGISIRKVAVMREICEQLPTLADSVFQQDGWASEGIKELKKTYDNSLFLEAGIVENPVGVHQWWTFIEPFEEHIQYYARYLTLKA